MTTPAKPMPDLDDPLTGPFWEGTARGELLMPTCDRCGYLQWPPEAVCPECQHPERTWRPYAAIGTLWSYAVYHRALDPAFAGDVPYAVGLIELDAGRKMYGLMLDEEADLQIGARVYGRFEPVDDRVTFLRWTMSGASDDAATS